MDMESSFQPCIVIVPTGPLQQCFGMRALAGTDLKPLNKALHFIDEVVLYQ